MAEDGAAEEPGREGEGESAGEEGPERGKPLSVRDVVPSSPARARPREKREEEDGDAGEETGGGAGEGQRPTPVRVAMDAPPPGDSRPTDVLPSRRFEAEGEEWIVRITGRTVTGTRPDPGAPLMALAFYPAEEPETPVRELLTVERELDDLFDEDLEELLARSRPVRAEG